MPPEAIRDIFVDLDGTLYPIIAGNDYEHHVRKNVFRFMHEKLSVPEADAMGIWQQAFAKYNQSLKGLKMSGYEFDDAEYWDFIRQGAEDFLTPNSKVRSCLLSLPQRKWLFTNANEKSARHCLQLLDLEGVFDGVIGADSMGSCCKPEEEAFAAAFKVSGASPSHTAMFEDSLKNLRTAKALGMVTVLIRGETANEEHVSSRQGWFATPDLQFALKFPRLSDDLRDVVNATISAPLEDELRQTLPQIWLAPTPSTQQ